MMSNVSGHKSDKDRKISLSFRQLLMLPVTYLFICLLAVHPSDAYGAMMKNIIINSQLSLIIADSSEGTISFRALESGTLEHTVPLGYKEWVSDMVLSPDGQHLGVTILKAEERIGTVGCYSISEKKWLWKKKLDESVSGSSVQFASKGVELIFQGFQGIVVYDALTGTISSRENSPSEVRKGYSCLSPTGRYLAAWGPRMGHNDDILGPVEYLRAKWAFVYDIEKKETILNFSRLLSSTRNCGGTFSPDEHFLLIGALDGIVRVWSVSDAKVVREWRAYGEDSPRSATNSVDSMVFSSDRRFLATNGFDVDKDRRFNIKIWDFSNNALLKVFGKVTRSGAVCGPYPMTFSSDGNFFAFEQNRKLCLYDTRTWQEKWCMP